MPARINLPPLTRGLFLVVLALSALNAALRFNRWSEALSAMPDASLVTKTSSYLTSPQWAIPYLVLIPLQSLRYPWTFLTASLVENNVASLAVSGAVVWFTGRYLERAYGSSEFAKFTLFVTMIPNILSFCIYAGFHLLSGTPEFPTPIQGLMPLEAGFLVALKQLVPEHTVSLFKGAVRVRVKHFPALFTLANIISGPLLGTDTALWLSLFGFLTSWIYLRFFRVAEIGDGGESGEGVVSMKGDASDTFSFVSFFPDFAHPLLSPICDTIYTTLVQLKLCTPFSSEAIEAGNQSAQSRSEGLPGIMDGSGGNGGGRRAEAERRRALALKALDQRLSAQAASNRATSAAPAQSNVPAPSGDMPPAEVPAGAGAEEGAQDVRQTQT
ncbi:DUF1751-domain-containing protein [Hortaea werneckii]|nr:DUF1751-domain-containing protein [Hortaea werneckii]